MADDDDVVRRAVVDLLARRGYRMLEARNGVEAHALVLEQRPTLLLLDVEMPELGGLALLKKLREAGLSLPVIILSHRVEVESKIKGLSIGADDYLGKPFDFEELLARVEALLRRSLPERATPRQFRLGDTCVDLDRMIARSGGQEIALTRTECSVLELLARHRGEPVRREQMFDIVWGYTRIPSTRTLDTHIWRLRKKVGDTSERPRWIKNVPGIGYQLDFDPLSGPA